jgi:hypothetical protein
MATGPARRPSRHHGTGTEDSSAEPEAAGLAPQPATASAEAAGTTGTTEGIPFAAPEPTFGAAFDPAFDPALGADASDSEADDDGAGAGPPGARSVVKRVLRVNASQQGGGAARLEVGAYLLDDELLTAGFLGGGDWKLYPWQARACSGGGWGAGRGRQHSGGRGGRNCSTAAWGAFPWPPLAMEAFVLPVLLRLQEGHNLVHSGCTILSNSEAKPCP